MKHTYIAVLRGINVGGHKKILMADLKTLLTAIGLTDVQTYIQSGNVVFSSNKRDGLEKRISEAIVAKYNWNVPVLVKTSTEIKAILDQCPFPKEKKEKSYFMLLYQPPLTANIETTLNYDFPGETFYITPQCVYLHSALGIGNSKLDNNFFERKLAVITTTRNYRTMMKLLELAG